MIDYLRTFVCSAFALALCVSMNSCGKSQPLSDELCWKTRDVSSELDLWGGYRRGPYVVKSFLFVVKGRITFLAPPDENLGLTTKEGVKLVTPSVADYLSGPSRWPHIVELVPPKTIITVWKIVETTSPNETHLDILGDVNLANHGRTQVDLAGISVTTSTEKISLTPDPRFLIKLDESR
jgi:hypothetical protein